VTVAIKEYVSPIVRDNVDLLRLTPVTEIVLALTETEHVAVFAPSFVLTMMVAEPTDLAVMTPDAEIVTTLALLDDHVTVLSEAEAGFTVTERGCVSPSVNISVVVERETDSTGTY
jgi:hypothetical protein